MRRNHVRAFLICTAAAGLACERATTQPVASVPPAVTASAPESPVDAFRRSSPAIIEQYFRDHEVRKLQIGAGSSRLAGWLNTDIEPGDGLAYLDATQPFPFEDGTLHYIFSEHVIEHLTYEEGKAMAAEVFRVLAPGGRVRISTPGLEQFLALFDPTPSEEARAYMAGKLAWHQWPREPNTAAIILNLQMSSWGHKFMYDKPTLAGVLTRAGFRRVQDFEENISVDPHLRGLEERDRGINARWSAYETMTLEAEKPQGRTTTSR